MLQFTIVTILNNAKDQGINMSLCLMIFPIIKKKQFLLA